MEELCPAEMADYDHVYYDGVTGATLPATQLEIKCMKEMNVHTPCEHGAVKERGLTPIGSRTRVIQNILSSGPDWLLKRRRERRSWIRRTRL